MATNLYSLPAPLVEALTPERRRPVPGRFGVTTLIDSPLRRILTMRHYDEIEEDVSDSIWALLGKMGHSVTEMNKQVSEIRIEKQIGDATLVGVADYANDGKVIDFKFTSVWTVIYASEKSDWEKQLQIYGHLVQSNGQPVTSLENWLILRDWNRRDSLKSDDYPKIPFAKLVYKTWSSEAVAAFISERLSLHLEAEKIEPGADLGHLTCSREERWARPDKWAVKKKTAERAIRVYDTKEAAKKHFGDVWPEVGGYFIEHRPGEDVRCESYCSTNRWCPYYTKGLV